MREERLKYLKAITIVHGKSERQICDFIISKLKLNIHIEAEKGGKKSIEITSINNILNNTVYNTFDSFITKFSTIELVDVQSTTKKKKGNKNKSSKKKLPDDFKIFIIMDFDNCTEKQRNEFVSKKMFEGHWAYDYIVPIYNDIDLEEVLTRCQIKFEKKGKERKKEYIKIFPTDRRYEKSDTIQIEEFNSKLKKCVKTNMDIFTQFCIDIS